MQTAPSTLSPQGRPRAARAFWAGCLCWPRSGGVWRALLCASSQLQRACLGRHDTPPRQCGERNVSSAAHHRRYALVARCPVSGWIPAPGRETADSGQPMGRGHSASYASYTSSPRGCRYRWRRPGDRERERGWGEGEAMRQTRAPALYQSDWSRVFHTQLRCSGQPGQHWLAAGATRQPPLLAAGHCSSAVQWAAQQYIHTPGRCRRPWPHERI